MKTKLKIKALIKIKGWLAVMCSYCSIIYDFKPSHAEFSGISHGICPDCFKYEIIRIEKSMLNHLWV